MLHENTAEKFWEKVDVLREALGPYPLPELLSEAWKQEWITLQEDSFLQGCLCVLEGRARSSELDLRY